MIERRKTKYCLSEEIAKEFSDCLEHLQELSEAYKIPMFATVAVSNDDEKTEYINTVYSSQSHLINLADDHIRKHMLIAKNFEVVPPRESLSINLEEVMDLE